MFPTFFVLGCATTPIDTADTATDTGDTAADTGDTAADTGDTGDSPYADVIAAIQRKAKSDLRANNASGVSVAVWKDGEIVYAEAFGTRHPDTDEAVATTTLFQIGSDTKKLTAIAALQQVQAGTLALDSAVGDVVTDLHFVVEPGLEAELTLHELLSHQGGIYDYTPWTVAPADSELHDRAVGRFAENEYALGPSGLFWNYANPNFSLAGLMTETAAGRPWGDVLEDDVFAPLGMTRSYARLADAVADGDYATGFGVGFPDGYDTFDPLEALGYTWGTVEVEDMADDGFTRPAGLVWSTASDMARLGGFLIDGDAAVLDDTLREAVVTPQVPMYPRSDAADYGYGYGLMVNNFGWSGNGGWYMGVPLWAHGGNTMTMTSAFYVLPEQRVVVSVLSNGYADDFTATAVTALEGFADLPEPGTGGSFLAEPGEYDKLVGTWEDAHLAGRLVVTLDGDTLLVDAPDLEAAGSTVGEALEPYALDLYLLAVDGTSYDLNYYENADGAWLINRQFSLKKVDVNALTATPPHAAGLPRPEPDVRPRALGRQ